ncbi:GNAT family protein [Acidithiobacillus sp. AMEEHan]|uniref:GNAT family protein n=1 Tax=Acidithiobacillus sp. AMEEHan TaxID=2994951 RepID=UPI0027E4BBDC|nr:GNAT family protein [Acidithiobacillus sp. AMEEHan]
MLAAEVHPADLDDLTACATNGTLDFITIDGVVAGLIATEPGEIDWVRGYVVIEEIMAPTRRGHGYAAQAQRLLTARLSETHGSESLIIGTIHHLNIASSQTATRAGRPEVMSYRFLSMS